MRISTDKAVWYEDADGFWLAFRTKDRANAAQISIQAVDGWTVEAKAEKQHRSNNANAYCWTLLTRLAEKLGTTKTELYLHYVREVGIYRDWELPPDHVDTFQRVWHAQGTGWPTELVDYTPDGENIVVRAYYGSSTYNPRQMSRLIDSIVEDAKEAGIETMTPNELALLKERWKSEP